ncbi:hypothetical protein D9611_008027 [Ephemerocybe angulata]|uniref:MYND-type domain-containing protein n=1 Tax=Ephemerocybe angulata TaxID=980116 RepID=A0A8H5FCM4_9AGAR|nr:hypothetical protein D9611_008027 [Tulosesus angulatus]
MRRGTRGRIDAVTPELASAGSIPDIILLAARIRGGKCSLEVLNVAFKFLRPELVPTVDRSRSDFRQPIDRAINCLAILDNACQQAASDSLIKAGLVDHLIENVDGICCWINFCLLIPEFVPTWKNDVLGAYNRNSAMMDVFLNMDDRVYDAYISSTGCIDLVLRVWFREDENRELLLDLETRSILQLLYTIVKKKRGLEILVKRIVEKRIAGRLALSVVRRARRVSEASSLATKPIPAISCIQILIATACSLVECENEVICKAFGSAHATRELCASLNTLTTTVQKGHAELLHTLVPSFHHLFATTMKARIYVVDNWVDIVEGGVIPLLAHLLPSVRSDDDVVLGFSMASISTLTTGVICHPRVIKRHLAWYPSGDVPDLIQGPSAITAYWKERWMQTTPFIISYLKRDGTVVTICDNHACSRRMSKDEPAQNNPSRQCASCSSVVYCSTECQEDDWKMFHSRECRQAGNNHTARRPLHTWYSHSDRQFHLTFAAYIVTSLSAQGHLPDSSGNPGNLLINLDGSKGKMIIGSIDIRSVQSEALWSKRENTAYSQEYLKARYASLINQFNQPQGGKDTRLVSFAVRFGAHEIIDMMVLLERVGEAYQAVYSVMRHGYDSEYDSLPPDEA